MMSLTNVPIAGIRVAPPVRMIWFSSDGSIMAWRRACSTGARQCSSRSCVMDSNSRRVRVSSRCRGPLPDEVRQGNTMVVVLAANRAIFAASAASRNRCITSTFEERSIPY
ncbi:hypothetical protein GCM10010339_66380 [Streptomyces alanosinicus]|uniref:Uncharacterized protein n=1 Tax=Streptomyces alanosinicus TaxID=68171 RepID=A0A918YPN5_9ACTN|nr:hypothetical protein GCM10010339_66380 [Streptomyces alanosinicus]